MTEAMQAMNEKTENEADKLIRRAYDALKEGNAAAALGLLKQALEIDFEHEELLYALKCLSWWMEKIKKLEEFREPFEKGEYILSQWKSYYGFLQLVEASLPSGKETGAEEEQRLYAGKYDSCQYAIKRYAYSLALENFAEVLGENQQDPALLLQAGRCCKGAGNWEEALQYLEQAGRLKKEDSAILSELADVNALLGDTRAAKALFREAFFLDPSGIDIEAMESEMIISLKEKVKSLGYDGPEIAEWIPVWGRIWGIFSVKRELKPVEAGRLKQSILSLENEFGSKSGGKAHLKPRLLNRYFWLIDHCEQNRDNSGYQNDGLTDETMLKIKVIDPAVYEQYRT